jgi:hypothetical protein
MRALTDRPPHRINLPADEPNWGGCPPLCPRGTPSLLRPTEIAAFPFVPRHGEQCHRGDSSSSRWLRWPSRAPLYSSRNPGALWASRASSPQATTGVALPRIAIQRIGHLPPPPHRQRGSVSPDSPVHAPHVTPSPLVLEAKTPVHMGHWLASGSHAVALALGAATT